jgi:NarL family two-component system sensor histidine kinase LiaS
MQRLRFLLSRLRWKLALTYTLVTVAALLVVELGLFGLSQFMEPVLLPPAPSRYAIKYIAPQLRPFLEGEGPDIEGLNEWLLRSSIQGFPFKTEDGQEAWIGLVAFFRGDLQLSVFDIQGHPLAAVPPYAGLKGQDAVADRVPGLEELWDRALSGETDPEHLYTYGDEKFLTVAAPILSQQGDTLGILAITGTAVSQANTDAPTFLSIIGASALLFAVAAGVIGLIFGLVAARGLSKRIGELAHASEAWSKGDFKVFVEDRSNDELGTLAQRLNRMAEQLQNLLHSRQHVAILEERNRLARDLHDSVKQKAFGLAAQLRTVRALLPDGHADARDHLEEAEQLTSQIRSELTGLIRELRPTALKEEDFHGRLRSYVDQWSHRCGIASELQGVWDLELSRSVERAFEMVLQEALSNVARHSQANQVMIELIHQDDMITMAVQDDGLGFDRELAKGHGLGLLSMRERMEALAGQLVIESDRGQGTRIIATCHLSQPATHQSVEGDSENEDERTD